MASVTGPGGRRRDRLKQLRAFCYSAELNSMSKAADRLCLSQPAVSQQIRMLESELSGALFERRGPKIALTAAGRSLYRLAMPLVRGIDRIPADFAEDFTGAASGSVHVAAGMTAAMYILPERLRAFQQSWPGVKVRVTSCDPAQGMALIRSHEADFGVGAMNSPPDDLSVRRFLAARPVCIVPVEHPLASAAQLTAADIAAHRLVLPMRGSHSRTVLEMAAQHFDIGLEAALEVNGWGAIKRYVECGFGMGFVPDICVAPFDRVRTVPFERRIQAWLRRRHYGVIVPTGRRLSRAAARLAEALAPGFAREG